MSAPVTAGLQSPWMNEVDPPLKPLRDPLPLSFEQALGGLSSAFAVFALVSTFTFMSTFAFDK